MKNRILFFCVLLGITCAGIAQEYRILYINTPSIHIGSQDKRVGDVFAANEPIHWLNNEQVMKVKDIASQEQLALSKQKMQQICASNTLSAYRRVTKGLYSRTSDTDALDALIQAFSQDANIEKEMRLPFKNEETNTNFYITYRYEGELVKKALTQSNDALTITREELYNANGKAIKPIPIEAELYQYESSSQQSKLLTIGFILPIE